MQKIFFYCWKNTESAQLCVQASQLVYSVTVHGFSALPLPPLQINNATCLITLPYHPLILPPELGTFGTIEFLKYKMIFCIYYKVNLTGSGLLK